MTIVSALKKLHKKMTGKDATGLNIANVIDSLQENYTGEGGGGSSLPPMSGSTNGQYLTNNGSAASWADAPEEVLEVTLTPTDSSHGTLDHGYAEIKTAMGAGKTVFVSAGRGSLSYHIIKADGGNVAGIGCDVNGNRVVEMIGTISDDVNIEFNMARLATIGDLYDTRPLVVRTTFDLQNLTATIPNDYTLGEIAAAIGEGRLVVLRGDFVDATFDVPLIYYKYNSSDHTNDEFVFGTTLPIDPQFGGGTPAMTFLGAKFTTTNVGTLMEHYADLHA